MILASVGCFSTAPYDAAHLQRVTNINARYEAAAQREQHHYAVRITALDQRHDLAARAPSPDPTALRAIEDEAQHLAQRHAQARHDLAYAHQRELDASSRERTAQIDLARAARRVRLRAAAFAANDPGNHNGYAALSIAADRRTRDRAPTTLAPAPTTLAPAPTIIDDAPDRR